MTITSLTLDAGAAPRHILVQNQDGVDLPPEGVHWDLDPAITAVTVTPDATGFMFAAPAGAKAASGPAVATWTANGVKGTMTVNVEINVTAVQFVDDTPAPVVPAPAPAA